MSLQCTLLPRTGSTSIGSLRVHDCKTIRWVDRMCWKILSRWSAGMDKRNHLSPDINNHRSLHLLIGRVIRKRKSWNGNLYSSLVSYTDPINIEERFGCTFCISRILKIATFCVGYTLPQRCICGISNLWNLLTTAWTGRNRMRLGDI